jgi:hypothetical protein
MGRQLLMETAAAGEGRGVSFVVSLPERAGRRAAMAAKALRAAWLCSAGLVVFLAVLVLGRPLLWPARGTPVPMGAPAPEAGQVVQDRIKGKIKVIDRLLAGELTLLEAAAWFRHLNDNPPEAPLDYRTHWPGGSDGEKLCRQVIYWVRMRRSPEAEGSAERLERELEELLAAGSEVELPW